MHQSRQARENRKSQQSSKLLDRAIHFELARIYQCMGESDKAAEQYHDILISGAPAAPAAHRHNH